MTGGPKEAVGSVVGSLDTANQKAEKCGTALLDRLGDKIFGKTAESEYKNAPDNASEASTRPINQSRRSNDPEAQSPLHSDPA